MSDHQSQKPPQPQWSTTRGFQRFQFDQRIVVRKTNLLLHGRSNDLSQGGMGAVIAGEIKIGDVVELEIQAPGNLGPLKTMAEVRYHRGFQYGFKFLNLTEEQKQSIAEITRDLPLEK